MVYALDVASYISIPLPPTSTNNCDLSPSANKVVGLLGSLYGVI